MNVFINDYNDVGHEYVIKKLCDAANEVNIGYGNDDHCANAAQIIKNKMGNQDVDIHFVHGGTMVNVLGLTHGLKSYEGVVAATSGHIIVDETGAIEATGHSIINIDTTDGKLTKELIAKKLEPYNTPFKVIPRIVFISNTTEYGTVYSTKEIEDIYNYCKENELFLYIDGARMASALTSDKVDFNIEDLPKICDAFTLGGTKNGALYGEALVLVNDELKKNFKYTMKQRGAMLAKSFNMGIQFEALFEDDLYFDLAKHANEMAVVLANGLREKDIELFAEPESNQIFIRANKELKERIEEKNLITVFRKLDEDNYVLRFITTYRTREEDIKNLLEIF